MKPQIPKKQIWINIEGGGQNRSQQIEFREGLEVFFREFKEKVSFRIIPGGSKDNTVSDFKATLASSETAFVVLVVDSDQDVPAKVNYRQFLQTSNPSWNLPELPDEHYHMMVQVMEAWFLADREALRTHYGQRFRENALPSHSKVEQVPKNDIYHGMEAATRETTKGVYQKRKHSAGILKLLDRNRVCAAAPHCKRLFDVLEAHC
ncbi:MAG TPA: DUF4276 family protein [bacterium]